MKSFKGYLLNEGNTDSATLGESAIVLAYNMSKGSDEQKAFEDGLVVKATQNKLIDNRKKGGKLIEIGQKVVGHASFGDKGKVLQMSGSSSKNKYDKGKDKTSKSDIHGDKQNNISIKKSGDNSESAQLMSAQGAEMRGVFLAGMKHFEAVEKIKVSKYEAFDTAVTSLETNMDNNKKTKLFMPYVGIGKTEISDWYINSSGRFKALKGLKSLKKYIGEKGSKEYENRKVITRKSTKSGVFDFDELIKRHMRAELMQINALTNSPGFTTWFLPELKTKSSRADSGWVTSKEQPSSATFNELITTAYMASTAPIGADVVKHDKAPDASKEQIKKDVVDLVTTSVKMPEWKAALEKEIGADPILHKWIVYEAASGLYKFTGKEATGNWDYSSKSEFQVANKILVFHNQGFGHEYGVYEFAAANGTALLGTLDINWKGSGRSRSPVARMASSVPVKDSYEYPETILSKTVNECVDAEWTTLNEELEQIHSEYLNEGIFADIAKGLKGAGSAMMTLAKKVADKFKAAWDIFYEKVIIRVVRTIREWGKKTATGFFAMMGLELDGRAYVRTPSW